MRALCNGRSSTYGALFALIAASALILGCQKRAMSVDGLAYEAQTEPSASLAPPAAGEGQDRGSQIPSSPQRKLIRNARVSMEVSSTEQATGEIRSLVEAAGGYIGDESHTEDGYGAKRVSLTCRVPAQALDGLLEQTKGYGEVESLEVTAQDITEQYFDLEIRLETESKLESRLVALLDRPSNQLSDLLEIERELARVRGQIDQMEGRRRLWDHQVALATLRIDLHEPRPVISGNRGGAMRTLGRAFRNAGDNFIDSLAFVISSMGALVPVVAVLAVLSWLVIRARRRRKKRRASKEPAES